MASNQNLKLVRKLLRHMEATSAGHQHGGILLAGDPGIGKTTFVEMFGSLLGMKVIVIEVPHVTEEHLINIPFIVFNPQTHQQQGNSSSIKQTDDYQMVLADSNLFTQLTTAAVMDDSAYIDHIKKSPAAVQNMYKALGGTEEQIPPEIVQARSRHKVILFLDEFYRATSIRIRNVMRGMLNGNIGMHKIPGSVYTMYASNMEDSGIDETPGNAQFSMLQYKAAPSKDWFDWLVAKYENDQHIRLDPEIIGKFKRLLNDEDFGHTDVAAAVRTSPRRWEQLLTYINSSFPIEDVSDARALVTNVRNNFIHYQTGQYSALADKVVAAVVELIQQTSGHNIKKSDEYEDSDWRETLGHMIKQQIKTGGKRKHIPVMSGPPGIGKTSHVATIAMKHNMRVIEVDVGELFADDAIGLPIPGQRSNEGITVRFSVPKLYYKIMAEIKRKDKMYLDEVVHEKGEQGAKEEIEKYKAQKFKYLIFFDELNRVDEKTFNAMRRVILEKNFGNDDNGNKLKLPDDAIVVAAINPDGVGTTEMTEHFRDVVDIVPALGSWKQTRNFLMGKKFKQYPDEMKDVALGVMDVFAKKFKHPSKNADQAPFHLDIGSGEVYMAPREYTDMFTTLVREVATAVRQGLDDPNIKEDQMRDLVDEAIADALEDTLNFPIKKAGLEPQEFLATLRQWVEKLPDSIFGGMLTKKVKNINSLSSTLEKYLDGHDLSQMPEDHHIVNANNGFNDAQVMQEIKEALHAKLVDDESVKHYILEETHPRATLKDEKITFDSSKKVSLLTNLFLSLLYTLHIHQFANNRIGIVGTALSQTMSEFNKTIVKDKKVSSEVAKDASMAAAELRSEILDVTSEL